MVLTYLMPSATNCSIKLSSTIFSDLCDKQKIERQIKIHVLHHDHKYFNTYIFGVSQWYFSKIHRKFSSNKITKTIQFRQYKSQTHRIYLACTKIVTRKMPADKRVYNAEIVSFMCQNLAFIFQWRLSHFDNSFSHPFT